jgi:uncharacterized protein (DUF2132 family)
MENLKSKDPLHGITLQKNSRTISGTLFDYFGELIKIKCFTANPSVKSSLTFLRKTEWARKQVEDLYLKSQSKFVQKFSLIYKRPLRLHDMAFATFIIVLQFHNALLYL